METVNITKDYGSEHREPTNAMCSCYQFVIMLHNKMLFSGYTICPISNITSWAKHLLDLSSIPVVSQTIRMADSNVETKPSCFSPSWQGTNLPDLVLPGHFT